MTDSTDKPKLIDLGTTIPEAYLIGRMYLLVIGYRYRMLQYVQVTLHKKRIV
jgi:hypothetical protein